MTLPRSPLGSPDVLASTHTAPGWTGPAPWARPQPIRLLTPGRLRVGRSGWPHRSAAGGESPPAGGALTGPGRRSRSVIAPSRRHGCRWRDDVREGVVEAGQQQLADRADEVVLASRH